MSILLSLLTSVHLISLSLSLSLTHTPQQQQGLGGAIGKETKQYLITRFV
jgi:hypothetical protein